MATATDFDSVDIEQLRRTGSLKWTEYPDSIGAFIAEMDFGTSPAVTKALHDAVDDGSLGYLPKATSKAMSEAAANWQKASYGWEVSPGRVHPIADVIKGLKIAIEHFSKPGSPVILPTPAFMPFLSVPIDMGREIIEIPLAKNNQRYEIDLDALDGAFRGGGDLLILCNPYNPVGRVFGREELVGISEVVAKNAGRVFSDEIHAPMVYQGAVHVPYASVSRQAAEHTVTATSASKAWNLHGLKCAQFITSNDVDDAIWEKIGSRASHGASNLGVIANLAAYTSGAAWLDDIIAYNDRNRSALARLLAEHIPGVRYTPPEGTYIAWLDCRELGLGDHPARFFREQAGVALTDGTSCGEPGAGFVRFIFAMPRPIMEQAVRQMARALRDHR